MSLYCPNINSPEYKALVEEVGEDNAVIEWDLKYGNKIGKEVNLNLDNEITNVLKDVVSEQEAFDIINSVAKKNKVNINLVEYPENEKYIEYGSYDNSTNTIELNKNLISLSTLLHEMAHPFVTYINNNDETLFNKLLAEAETKALGIKDFSEIETYNKMPQSWRDQELIVRVLEKEYNEKTFKDADSLYQKFMTFLKSFFNLNKIDISKIETIKDLYSEVLNKEIPQIKYNKDTDNIAKNELENISKLYETKIDNVKNKITNLEKQIIKINNKEIGSKIMISVTEYLDEEFEYTLEMKNDNLNNLKTALETTNKDLKYLKSQKVAKELEIRKNYNNYYSKDTKTKFKGKYFEGDPKELNKTELKRLFSISKYLNLSERNKNMIRDKVDSFNTRFNTSHKIPTYKIAESNSINIELIVDTSPRNEELKRINTIRRLDPDNRTPKDQDIIDGGQTSMFSLENSNLDTEQQRKTKLANNRLEKILTNDLNVSIEFLNDFKSKYGVDANGVADIAKKLIEVNNMEYLPEEAAHMIFEMIKDSKLQEGLLNLARQSEEYKQVWKDYGETYNNDELRIAKETAGKLLAKAFVHTSENPVINNESESMIRRLIKSAQSIFNMIQKMLNSDPNIKTNLNEVFNDLAISIYSNNIGLDQNKPSERNVFFSKKADDNTKKVQDAKGIVEEAISVLKNKIRVNKDKSTDADSKSNAYVTKTKEILKGLEKDLDNAQYANAIQSSLNKINSEFNGSTNKVADSFQMKEKIDELEKKAESGEVSLNKLAKELRVMYQHYSSYQPIITELINAFNTDSSFKDDMLKTLTLEQYNDLERQVLLINGRLSYLENKYYQLGSYLTTKYGDVYSKQKNKVRSADGNLLSNTILVEDDTLLAKRVFAASESNDELLRLIDTMNKDVKQDARNLHLDLTTDVLNKYDSFKTKIKDFNYIAHKDSKGKLTGRFLTKENNPTAYNKLSKDQKEYLNFLYNTKLEQEKGLPKRFRTGDLLPQYRKDLLERIKNDPKNVGSTVLDLFRARTDDTDFGIKNELGDKVNFLPIYGTTKLDKVEDLSLDVTSTLLLHSMFIIEYKEMSKVIDALEMMKDLAGNRTVVKSTKVDINDLKNLTVAQVKQKYDTVQAKSSHNFKWIEDFFKMQFYGQMKKDTELSKSGNFKIPGTDMEFNWVKTLDTFGRYVGLNSLGGNIFSGINNLVLGRLMTNIEGIVGDYYNLKHLYSADKELANPLLLDDVGRKIPTHKAHIWARYRNVMQQYESDVYNINADRKTKAGQIIDSSLPYMLASSGEFLIQMRSSIALAKSINLKDKAGNKINFYNAFDIVNNKMILKKGLTVDGKNKIFGVNRQGTEVTEADVKYFERVQDRINNKLHGVYNNVDKNTLQQFALGRLAIMFRKFLTPTLRRKFGKAKFNEDMGETEEGYYFALLRFMGYQKEQLNMTRSQLLGLTSKDNLTAEDEMQINNLRRSLVELGTFLGLLVLTSFILDDLEPDDDDWALNMFIYQTNRLYTEVAAFTPTPFIGKEFLTILSSPAAAVNQLEAVSKLFNHVIDSDSWTEEIDRGSYEGFTPVQKSVLQLTPMEKNIRSWFNPKEKNNWFNRN